jgi:carbon monoxide dehydrogenase subunit G
MPNTRITTLPLPLGTTESATGFTHAFKVTHADLDLTTNATAQTLELIDVKAGDIVLACAVHVRTQFKDSADNAFNTTAIEVGDGGDVDRFLASMEVNANGTVVTSKAGTGTMLAYTAADTVDIKVSSMAGKNLNALTQGELIVLLRIVNMADIAKAAFQQ